jgi:hypothetical protein
MNVNVSATSARRGGLRGLMDGYLSSATTATTRTRTSSLELICMAKVDGNARTVLASTLITNGAAGFAGLGVQEDEDDD